MSNLAKATIGLMIATLLSKILGFARELVLAAAYGASSYSDAYLIASNIPLVIFVGIASALSTTFIPMYYDIHTSKGGKESLKFTNNIFNIVTSITILLSIVGFVFSKPIVKIFAIGFEGETLDLAVNFTKVMIWGIVFIGMRTIITAFLNSKNNFYIPGLIGIPFNIIIIVSILLSSKLNNIYLLVWGTLLGILSQFLFQLPFATKIGYKYSKYINLKEDYIEKVIWLVVPVFIGIAVNQINTMVDRTLASTLVEGSISALNYANKLNQFIMSLFITSISAVIYPRLSKLSCENDEQNFIESIVKSINSVTLLIIPVTVGAIVLSKPIVKILFQRGEFDSIATQMTSVALIFYSIGLIGMGLRDIIGKVFYSLKDTKTPMINGSVAMVINIILNIILIKFMGHAGLAFATSISSIICILLLFRSLKKKVGYFGQDKIISTTLKCIGASIIMGISTFIIYNYCINMLGVGFIYEIISLGLSILSGAIVYLILIMIFRIEEVDSIILYINKKIKCKKDMKEYVGL